MKAPVRVAVTGAAGQIGYSLLFRIAAGEMLGPDQPVILQMLEIPQRQGAEGAAGRHDGAGRLRLPAAGGHGRHRRSAQDAFQDADIALLVGARPRGPGMERKDLLMENAKIFIEQGRALNEAARRHVRVLVVGNPANTNAYIAMKNAPDLDPRNFTAMMRLDHNRAVSQVAAKVGKPVAEHPQDHHLGQPLRHAVSGPVPGGGRRARSSGRMINDQAWLEGTFIPTVQKRGAAIIEARGASSAASAANAAIDHVRDWIQGTPGGDWVTMGIPVRRQLRHPRGRDLRLPGHLPQRRLRDRPGHRHQPLQPRPHGRHAQGTARGARRREGHVQLSVGRCTPNGYRQASRLASQVLRFT